MHDLFMALVVLLCAGTSAHAQRGVIVDYATAPAATEAELFNRSVVVVRGRVEARRIDHARNSPTSSVYTLRIFELLRTDGRSHVDGTIDVHRHGGLDWKTEDLNFPPFDVNDEVMLFLERGDNGWYWPLNGPDGAFKLTNHATLAYGRAGVVSRRHHGRPVEQFLLAMRKYKK